MGSLARVKFTLDFEGTRVELALLLGQGAIADDSDVLQHLDDLGDQMSALSDKVDQVLALEADEDAQAAAALAAKDAIIADLQSQLATAGEQLTTAMANDAADAQAIADAQAQIAADAADTQAQIDRLNEAFPAPPAEPPVEPPVEEVPPAEG